ncbi:ABC transporter substrate-binding protein [Mycetocola sp. JXN-3]|uniref:ABC transporter substrate-binding protein n=1 Tax=Mycetocola sp. JXN-3 TaxID=2116510 RepID=UPI00165D1491|nr:extracellular solute-binding protein [Mycetocola sp. JXN-3]
MSRRALWRGTLALAAAAAIIVPLSACSTDPEGAGKTTIELFQNKTEAIGTVNKLIAEFEKTHPKIRVIQTSVQDSVTVLKSRLAKENPPDLIALNVSAYYDLAQAEVLKDLSKTEAFAAVSDTSSLEYMREAGQTKQDLAVPWATNAQTVFYNVDEYNKYGLSVPTTWAEFIHNAQVIKDAHGVPFSFGWKDNWSSMALVNSVVASGKPVDLLAQLQQGKTTFETQPQWKIATAAMLDLKKFAQPDPWGANYDTSLANFANGDSAMYVDGTWAIPTIRQSNPDLKFGVFVMPSPDPAAETKAPAGPDSFLSISSDTKHPVEAQEFLDFLLSAPAQKTYADGQSLFSVRGDVSSDDPLMEQLKTEWIDTRKTATYSDGYFFGGTNYRAITWTYLNSGKQTAFLRALDRDFATYGLRPGN